MGFILVNSRCYFQSLNTKQKYIINFFNNMFINIKMYKQKLTYNENN